MNRPLPGDGPRRRIYRWPARAHSRHVDYFVVGGQAQILPLRVVYRALRKAGHSPYKARAMIALVATTRGEMA